MNFPFDDWPYNDNTIPSELRNFNENEIPTREDLMAAGADRRFISLVFDGHSGNEDSDEEEDEEDEEDEDDEEYVPDVPPASRVSHEPPRNPISDEVIVIPDDERQNSIEDERNKRRRTEAGEASCSSIPIESADCSQDNDYRTDIDGLICPICMDAWTDNGDHHVCCLPCGHIYGMSCIKKWLQQRKNPGKCPQCNTRCSMKDVRKLYASRIVAVDEESHKRIRSLESKCASFESKDGSWRKKETAWKKKEAALHLDVQKLTKRNTYLEQLVEDMQSRQSELMVASGNSQWRYESERNCNPMSHGKGSFCNFECQKTFHLEGARVFDMDTSNQILLIARKEKAMGDVHLLTKMSLISPFEMQDIVLPSSANGIRDLHISPFDSRQALYASFGKTLSVLSLGSGTPVLNYDLQVPAWSCSWDHISTHNIYAGLQNGSVLVFDMRQTSGPLKSLAGLTSNPIHSLQSLAQTTSLPSGARTILSASAIGPCQWDIDSEERPFMVPGTDNQGVCISLAYCPSSDDIVVSYRPKFNMSMDVPLSPPSPTPSHVTGQGVQGSNVLLKRMGGNDFQKMGSSYANVSKIRLPKSVIIDIENQNRMFASRDEVTCDLVLQELPSFRVIQRFKMPAQARDIRISAVHKVVEIFITFPRAGE
ncbi:E3 ubiquitin-protein ligase RFWD3 [Trifolium repens]|nr:E3 ubiquitin-protein ligase RFWD3 [Trifolium repens]